MDIMSSETSSAVRTEEVIDNVNTQSVDRTNINNVDNEICQKSVQSNDSVKEKVINLTEAEEMDNKLAYIKTEPLEDESKYSNSSKNIISPIQLVADYQDSSDHEGEAMDTTDKQKEVKVILEVKKGQPPLIEVNSDDDSSSDSSSDSSDSESSSSDDNSSVSLSGGGDTEVEEEEQSVKEDSKKTKQKAPSKESAALQEEVPDIVYPELILPEDVVLIEMGHVSSIIGQLVVVQSKPEVPALNVDSVLFKESRQAVGAVYDVFGPVVNPLYSIAFNTAADITDQKIILNMPVFFAPHIKDITAYVFTDKLRRDKGSDASWKNDEEPPEECLAYSDDEQERMAKNKKQEGKEGRRRKKPQRRDRGNSESNEEGGRQHHHRGHRQQWQRNRPQHDDHGHHRGPPPDHGNGQFDGQFDGNMFPNSGYQFPPRPPGHQHHPRHPPPPHMFPPRPPGFMGGGPPPPFHNGPPNMGFDNQGPPPGQFKQEPFGVPPGPFQGPPPMPFPNGGFDTKPMIPPQQNSQGGMFGGMWQPPPPPPPPPLPPNANLRLPGPQNVPPHLQHPPPGYANQYQLFPPPPPPPPSSESEMNGQWQNQNFQ